MKLNKIPKEKQKQYIDLIEIILASNKDLNKYQLSQLVIDLCFCISQVSNYNFLAFESIRRYFQIKNERSE